MKMCLRICSFIQTCAKEPSQLKQEKGIIISFTVTPCCCTLYCNMCLSNTSARVSLAMNYFPRDQMSFKLNQLVLSSYVEKIAVGVMISWETEMNSSENGTLSALGCEFEVQYICASHFPDKDICFLLGSASLNSTLHCKTDSTGCRREPCFSPGTDLMD